MAQLGSSWIRTVVVDQNLTSPSTRNNPSSEDPHVAFCPIAGAIKPICPRRDPDAA
jgi:hypothetical protein